MVHMAPELRFTTLEEIDEVRHLRVNHFTIPQLTEPAPDLLYSPKDLPVRQDETDCIQKGSDPATSLPFEGQL